MVRQILTRMKFKTSLGKSAELTLERKKHIFLFHPDLKLYFERLKDVLLEPNGVRISKSDPKVLLFYKYFDTILNGKYIMVGIKTNGRWFILTSYLTDKILSGEKYAKE